MYIDTHMYITTINKIKKAINLKRSKETYMRGFGARKGKQKFNYTIISYLIM